MSFVLASAPGTMYYFIAILLKINAVDTILSFLTVINLFFVPEKFVECMGNNLRTTAFCHS